MVAPFIQHSYLSRFMQSQLPSQSALSDNLPHIDEGRNDIEFWISCNLLLCNTPLTLSRWCMWTNFYHDSFVSSTTSQRIWNDDRFATVGGPGGGTSALNPLDSHSEAISGVSRLFLLPLPVQHCIPNIGCMKFYEWWLLFVCNIQLQNAKLLSL